MRIRYDEDLLEAAVFVCASGRRPGVPSLQVARFHCERERLYRILDPDERNTAFFKLHLDWFREWGLEARFSGLLREYPVLPASLDTFAVRQARGQNDEGAELFVNEAGQRNAVVALRPERFGCDDRFLDFLRHEFMHLADMLDPAFGYSPELQRPGGIAAQQRLARERYRLLWDISIDGRLAARNHAPSSTRDQHWAAFVHAHPFWPAEQQHEVFDSLWENPHPAHAGLADLACDPRGLRDLNQPAPGAPCPLCNFPTFDWVFAGRVRADLAAFIQNEFPRWTPEHGLCGRCHEVYGVARRSAVTPADGEHRSCTA